MADESGRAELNVAGASELLGVKAATLYAYVSRGLLERRRGADGRTRFAAADVERLARRSRAGGAADAAAAVSSITSIDDRALRYRGRDAAELAAAQPFEVVANWLWTGRLEAGEPWLTDREALGCGAAAQAALPARAVPLDRIRVVLAAVAATDDLRHDTGTEAVVVSGRRVVSAMVDCLPERSRPAGAALAARLWSRLAARRPARTDLAMMNAALVLIADHELSTSTLAARLAASIRADPYAVVSVGLSALGGGLYSVAALAAEDLLAEIGRPEQASSVIGERLRRGERLPGFGHRLHPGGDPRARILLDLLRADGARAGRLEIMEAVLDVAGARGIPPPNVDFALAAAVRAAGMVRGASEAVFAVARAAGWLAHAIEEYETVDRRGREPRAIYLGGPAGPER